MPCDHAYSVLKEDEAKVIWKRNTCVHKSYWAEVGGDINNYYIFREAFIRGFLSGKAVVFEKIDEFTNMISMDIIMNSIDLMVEEHKNIIRMLKVVRKACYKILQGNDICYEDFEMMIDFIRNYADVHHHGKEEKFLFKEMVTSLGNLGNTLINHGMLVEHNLGRLYISQLSEALERVKAGKQILRLEKI